MAEFAASVLTDLSKLIAKYLLMQAVMGIVSMFSGGISTKQVFNAQGGVGMPQRHTGNQSGVIRQVDPSLFFNAPRLHGGLAADEYPAILQKGEEVIPKNKVGKSAFGGYDKSYVQANNITNEINVTVGSPGGGQRRSAAEDDAFGRRIGKAIQEEFKKNLMDQKRPGNILNKGWSNA
jgi:hypothetical protein